MIRDFKKHDVGWPFFHSCKIGKMKLSKKDAVHIIDCVIDELIIED